MRYIYRDFEDEIITSFGGVIREVGHDERFDEAAAE